MAISDELMTIEKGFWTNGPEYYRQHLDDSCLIAFTEIAGVMGRDAVAATVKDSARWQDLTVELKGLVQPEADVVILSYQANAKRVDGQPYAAL